MRKGGRGGRAEGEGARKGGRDEWEGGSGGGGREGGRKG